MCFRLMQLYSSTIFRTNIALRYFDLNFYRVVNSIYIKEEIYLEFCAIKLILPSSYNIGYKFQNRNSELYISLILKCNLISFVGYIGVTFQTLFSYFSYIIVLFHFPSFPTYFVFSAANNYACKYLSLIHKVTNQVQHKQGSLTFIQGCRWLQINLGRFQTIFCYWYSHYGVLTGLSKQYVRGQQVKLFKIF